MTLPLRCPGCRRPRPQGSSSLPGPATLAAGLLSDPGLGRGRGGGGAAGAPPPSPRLRVAACARELRRRRRRRPGAGSREPGRRHAEPARGAAAGGRGGGEAGDAGARGAWAGRAGLGPGEEPAGARADGGCGPPPGRDPQPGPWCPFPGLLAPPPRPSCAALPASRGFFPDRACSQLLSRSLRPPNPSPRIASCLFLLLPESLPFPNSSVPNDP